MGTKMRSRERVRRSPQPTAAPGLGSGRELETIASNPAISRMLAADPMVSPSNAASEHDADRAESGGLQGGHDAPRGHGGSPLRTTVRRSLEASAGVDLSGVRVHDDAAAHTLTRAAGAEAMSYGGDVFFSKGAYSPGSTGGGDLLAHELRHVTNHDAGQVHMKRVKKHLDFVRMKRNETHITRMVANKALTAVGADDLARRVDMKDGVEVDHYGHWWVETGQLTPSSGQWTPDDSYGWWPDEQGVSIKQTLKVERVEGILNKGRANDPHHGDKADVEFHPVMEVDDTEDYDTVHDRVLDQIDDFARNFKGSWNWRLSWGKNCHTFQERMKKQLGFHYQKSKFWLRDPAGGEREQQIHAQQAKDAVVGPWKRMEGFGSMLFASPDAVAPDWNVVTDEFLRGLSEPDKQQILDYVGATPEDLNDYLRHYGRAEVFS